MKLYRVIGIVWMGLCVFSATGAFFYFLYLNWLFEGKFTADLYLSEFGICIYVAGVVGSAFVPRGAILARVVVAFSAFFTAMFCGLAIEFDTPPHWLTAVFSLAIIFSWISIIILLTPKKYIA